MNENLNKEIEKKIDEYYTYCEEKLKNMADDDTDISFLTLDSFAKYFYNLALSDVEKEVINLDKHARENFGLSQFNTAYDKVIDMIKNKKVIE